MKHGIYAFYDMKTESFVGFGLMVIATDPAAIRNFAAAISQEGNQISASPEDFSLIRLGSYDLVHNVIVPSLSDPVANPVCRGRDIILSMRAKRDAGAPEDQAITSFISKPDEVTN